MHLCTRIRPIVFFYCYLVDRAERHCRLVPLVGGHIRLFTLAFRMISIGFCLFYFLPALSHLFSVCMETVSS